MQDQHQWIETLYDTHSEGIYRFFRYRTTNADTAADLTGEVFLRALDRAGTYAPDRGSERVWLYRIARNLLYDEFRRMARQRTVPIEGVLSAVAEAQTPEMAMIEREGDAALSKALRHLSKREMAIVAMQYAGDLPQAEIAAVMRLTEKNVSVIVARSRKKLRTWLEKEGYHGSSF